ncbi:MAG: hypothetical protein ABSH20_20385 [Tepidisphaeraceae bacterium]|jgi:hypothetical protein
MLLLVMSPDGQYFKKRTGADVLRRHQFHTVRNLPAAVARVILTHVRQSGVVRKLAIPGCHPA